MRLTLAKRSPLPGWIEVLVPVGAILVTLTSRPFPSWRQGGISGSLCVTLQGGTGHQVQLSGDMREGRPSHLYRASRSVCLPRKILEHRCGRAAACRGHSRGTDRHPCRVPSSRGCRPPSSVSRGFLAGGAWAAIPAILKTKYKVDDVVTSLLLNYVMWHIMGYLLFGPLQMPGSSWPARRPSPRRPAFPYCSPGPGSISGSFSRLRQCLSYGSSTRRRSSATRREPWVSTPGPQPSAVSMSIR